MPKSAAVVDVIEKAATAAANVNELARAAYARDLAAYRAGCRSMAAHDMQLPEDEAAELLAVCGRLGIDPERLSADATAFIRLRNVETRLAEIEARNAARSQPLPGLAEKLDEVSREYATVRVECAGRMEVAEKKLMEARRAYTAAVSTRDEPTDRERHEIRQVRDKFPHLFADMPPDELRRFLARS